MMLEIEKKVLNWAEARGLIKMTTAEKQCLKLVEEVGELADAVLKEDIAKTIDAIGDVLVVLTNLCAKLDIDLSTCYSAAYNEIKDRKGTMKNGTFVKEG